MKEKLTFGFEDLKWARKILDLPMQVTQQEIKKAYYDKTRKYHPDRCKDPEEAHRRMVEINRAYEIIVSYCRNYCYSFDLKDWTFYRGSIKYNPKMVIGRFWYANLHLSMPPMWLSI